MGWFDKFQKKEKEATEIKSAEERFWDWFVANKSELEAFMEGTNKDYAIYDELTKRIKTYHQVLFAELTKDKNNNYVIVITPDGLKEGVDATKKLGESHPEIENWVVQKFRQPMDDIRLEINGVSYPPSDIEIYAEVDKPKDVVHVGLFIRNMDADEHKYKTIAWLYLDHIIGEYNSITKLGAVEFYNLKEGEHVKDGMSLLELRKLIEDELYLA